MTPFTTRESVRAVEAKGAWDTLDVPKSIYQLLSRTKAAQVLLQMYDSESDEAMKSHDPNVARCGESMPS